MVKDGELDTGIAESLNDTVSSTGDSHETYTQTDTQTGVQGGKQTAKSDWPVEEMTDGHYDNQEDTANQDKAFYPPVDEMSSIEKVPTHTLTSNISYDNYAKLLTSTSSQRESSSVAYSSESATVLEINNVKLPQATDHIEMGPVYGKQACDIQEQCTSDSHPTTPENSQTGRTCPKEVSSLPKYVDDGNEFVPKERNPRPDHLPLESLLAEAEENQTSYVESNINELGIVFALPAKFN